MGSWLCEEAMSQLGVFQHSGMAGRRLSLGSKRVKLIDNAKSSREFVFDFLFYVERPDRVVQYLLTTDSDN